MVFHVYVWNMYICREFPANEVAMYASLNGLDSIAIPHFTSLVSLSL